MCLVLRRTIFCFDLSPTSYGFDGIGLKKVSMVDCFLVSLLRLWRQLSIDRVSCKTLAATADSSCFMTNVQTCSIAWRAILEVTVGTAGSSSTIISSVSAYWAQDTMSSINIASDVSMLSSTLINSWTDI